MIFEVRDAKIQDCGKMARILRIEHHTEIAKTGFDAHRELRSIFANSFYRKALLIDEKLIAMGGVTGGALATVGYVWLAVSNDARKHPLSVIRHARAELDRMMVMKRSLAAMVLADDDAAKRAAVFLGFYPAEGTPFGIHTRNARATQQRILENDVDLRLPCGNTYHIGLIYHPERVN